MGEKLCRKCAYFLKDGITREEYVKTEAVKVTHDYCRAYREVVRNEARAEKCRRYVEKKEVGELDKWM
jgi:ribosomal protein L40E